MAAGRRIVFKIAAKRLQIETWLLPTAYRYSLSPCPTVALPTLYDVPFTHNTFVTVKETTERRHIAPKAQPNGRL